MTASADNGRLGFDFSFSSAARLAARVLDAEAPFRILVLADFGGRGETSTAPPLAQRKPLRVDIDNLDAVMAKLDPAPTIDFGAGPTTITIRSIDDFHPDALFKQVAAFATLRDLRTGLSNDREFPRLAEQLRAAPPASLPAPPPAADSQEELSDIERLFGRKLQATPPPAESPLQSWLTELVAPFVQPNVANEQKQWLAAVDSAIAEEMRRLLHHPAFQALEAAWRGTEKLVREFGGDEQLQLHLLDVSRSDLVADLQASGGDLTQTALCRHLVGSRAELEPDQRWSLLVADIAFGPDAQDIRLADALSRLAANAGAALLAGANVDLTDPAAKAAWSEVRQGAAASGVGLVAPRVLLRLPYGAAGNPIESFEFEEMATRIDHAHYLWGNAAFALAGLAAEAFREDGWGMSLASHVDLSDLPSHVYRDEDGEPQQLPCAEMLMSDALAKSLVDAGVMPLLSWRNRDAARLLRWQSIADPATALAGPWGE